MHLEAFFLQLKTSSDYLLKPWLSRAQWTPKLKIKEASMWHLLNLILQGNTYHVYIKKRNKKKRSKKQATHLSMKLKRDNPRARRRHHCTSQRKGETSTPSDLPFQRPNMDTHFRGVRTSTTESWQGGLRQYFADLSHHAGNVIYLHQTPHQHIHALHCLRSCLQPASTSQNRNSNLRSWHQSQTEDRTVDNAKTSIANKRDKRKSITLHFWTNFRT